MAVAGGHLPGLTGLRGIAVGLVVAYHLGHLRGGFVGVDVFFVLSGFLITSLLLEDTPGTPADMVRWWGRRVRRLTPAVAVTVLVVAIAFATSSGIALDGLATLTWWQNWHLVAEGSPYWSPSPSPLRHAWSLSIEEQVYLLWPPVLVGLGSFARTGLEETGDVAPFLLVGLVLAIGISGSLNSIALGDDLAAALGAKIRRTRVLGLASVTLLAGGATALTGGLGFVGLVVPHVVRWFTGPDQRWIILYSALAAPILVLASDALGRVIARPGEIEVGVLTAMVGAPVLIALVRRRTASGL